MLIRNSCFLYIYILSSYAIFPLLVTLLGVKAGDFVVWELGTGKKQLLPKIGSPLLYFIFSSDSTLSSVRVFPFTTTVESK